MPEKSQDLLARQTLRNTESNGRKSARRDDFAAKQVGDQIILKPNAKQAISNIAHGFAHKWTPRYTTWMMHVSDFCFNCMYY